MQATPDGGEVVGVQAQDALRLIRSGAFDIMSVQIGQASRDDPFFEGIDLIGVSTDMAQLRKAVDAYRDAFDKRLQAKFNAKVLTLWPFGPQVFYCNTEIKSLDDLKGLKVRSFTPSMAALIQHLGEDFGRVRIGIGPKTPEQMDSADFVLAKFSSEQQKQLKNLTRETTAILSEYCFSDGHLPTETRSFIV